MFDKNNIVICDDYALIILINRKYEEVDRAIIDIEDIELVQNYRWSLMDKNIVRSTENGKTILLHRLIMNCPDEFQVDHINHNRLDNRKSNLRICNNQQNNRNIVIQRNNTSGHRGVSWNSRRKSWEVSIKVNYKKIHLGFFADFDEAVKKRLESEEFYFGEFAPK